MEITRRNFLKGMLLAPLAVKAASMGLPPVTPAVGRGMTVPIHWADYSGKDYGVDESLPTHLPQVFLFAEKGPS